MSWRVTHELVRKGVDGRDPVSLLFCVTQWIHLSRAGEALCPRYTRPCYVCYLSVQVRTFQSLVLDVPDEMKAIMEVHTSVFVFDLVNDQQKLLRLIDTCACVCLSLRSHLGGWCLP